MIELLSMLNEDNLDSKKYTSTVELLFEYDNVYLFKNLSEWKIQQPTPIEIDSIYSPNITVTYNIGFEVRSWGIKNFYIYNIQGPKNIEITIAHYNEKLDRDEYIDLPLLLDWTSDNINYEHETSDIVKIGDEITVSLKSNSRGDIYSSGMSIPILAP